MPSQQQQPRQNENTNKRKRRKWWQIIFGCVYYFLRFIHWLRLCVLFALVVDFVLCVSFFFVFFLFCCCCLWMRVFGTNSHNISLYAATNTHTHKPTRLNESQHRNRFYLTECHITFLNHFIYALFILHYYGWNINNISFKKSRI